MYYYFARNRETDWELFSSSDVDVLPEGLYKIMDQIYVLYVAEEVKRWDLIFIYADGKTRISGMFNEHLPEGLRAWELVLGS